MITVLFLAFAVVISTALAIGFSIIEDMSEEQRKAFLDKHNQDGTF